MATGFAFEITAIENLTARVVLRDGDATFQVACHSLIGFDGLGQFLQAVSVVVSERLWGAVCHWAGGQNDGWLVDVRTGSAWYEVTVFPEEGKWPPATQTRIAVFSARIDELSLARATAAAYASVLECYGAARYK